MMVEKRVNTFTKGGEKAIIERKVRESRRELERRDNGGRSGVERREGRLNHVKPVMETKSMKRSGIAQQIPTPVNDQRGLYRACNWIREASRKRAKKIGVPLMDARRMELVSLYEECMSRESGVERNAYTTYPMQMRDRTHRAAKSNRVFAVIR